ncbi:hypothetical protein [Streptomyces sp. MP131-18]|uniref:hypothetical protein n=1 Tax=Streptomyces sp. MP131-18 TaxID=1857892 RepID=UPI00097C598A|nr:hypothetical protein [Streptomyces sp. MP131-18]ONK11161.1 hypothetical protein STBA_18900 [Streptomyces sp. MP131-18]
MNEASKAAFAAGIAGGYLMGRRKRAKIAFAVATYVVGRRFPLGPRKLAGEGVRKLREHPQFSEVGGRLGNRLAEAGRTVASGAVGRRIESLTEAVEGRVQALDEPENAGPESESGDEARRPAKKNGKAERSAVGAERE